MGQLLSMHERVLRAVQYLRDTKGQRDREKCARVLVKYIQFLSTERREYLGELIFMDSENYPASLNGRGEQMSFKTRRTVVFDHRCERCGYKWTSENFARRCSKCKSPYWNRKRGSDGRRKRQ